MLMSYMSEEDIASFREFMDAGNGDAMYEYMSIMERRFILEMNTLHC